MSTESNTDHGPSDRSSGAQGSERLDELQAAGEHAGTGLGALARRHPALTVAGAATLGLFGGIEVAAGIVVGAAVFAWVRDRAAPGVAKPHRARELAHELWSELPRTVRERTRAIIDAARGKPTGQPPTGQPPTGQPSTDQTMAGSMPSAE
jgi:hypothetical protein